jgi:UDP-N-acetylmuramate dehydrogenase
MTASTARRCSRRLSGSLDGIRGRLTPNAPMDQITWFRTGGPAELLFQPADEDDLADIPEGSAGGCAGHRCRRSAPTCWCATAASGRRDPAVGEGFRPGGSGLGDADTRRRGDPRQEAGAVALDAGIGGFHFYHGIPGGSAGRCG